MTAPAVQDTKTCEVCDKPFTRRIYQTGAESSARFESRRRCSRYCGVNTMDIAALFTDERITYRQADYWLHRFPHLFSALATGSGTGRARHFQATDVVVLRGMARLVHAGLTPTAAARVIADGEGLHEVALSEHVVVRVIA